VGDQHLHRRFQQTYAAPCPQRNAGRCHECGTLPRIARGARLCSPCPAKPGWMPRTPSTMSWCGGSAPCHLHGRHGPGRLRGPSGRSGGGGGLHHLCLGAPPEPRPPPGPDGGGAPSHRSWGSGPRMSTVPPPRARPPARSGNSSSQRAEHDNVVPHYVPLLAPSRKPSTRMATPADFP
jgi:hypothetical protein